jgi:hypothetical protein
MKFADIAPLRSARILGAERGLPRALLRPWLRHEGAQRIGDHTTKVVGAVTVAEHVIHKGHSIPPFCTTGTVVRG